MSSYLADALGKDPDTLNRSLVELENITGNPSEDVRLASELIVSCRDKIASLGLDPDDTTAKELYGALNAHFSQTRQAMARTIGSLLSASVIADLVSHLETSGVWSPRPALIKKLLLQHPPRRLMKVLHYRTAESMLKRENLAKIAAAAGICEPESWRRSFNAKIKKAGPQDLQIEPVKILVFASQPWSEMPGDKLVELSCVAGAIIVRPNLQAGSDSVSFLLEITGAIEKLSGLSKLTALQLLKKHTHTAVTTDGAALIKIGGLNMSLAAYNLNDSNLIDDNNELSNPANDNPFSIWQQLCRLHPALGWWSDSRGLIYVDKGGEAVSLDAFDAASNEAGLISFANRRMEAGRRSLQDRLAGKYSQAAGVDKIRPKPLSLYGQYATPRERLENLQARYGLAYAQRSVGP